mmetsp:Transcript_3640/g.5254  ORF Transcript_3640/g.5254 Transcript_3640/m.5254 type:complete len:126 (+) Transcript_3640:265-642(+)
MRGISRVIVGYSGGEEKDPTYQDIKDSTESVLIEFDPSIISYDEILNEWSKMASPFYPSKTQYRSAIFYNSEDQQNAALNKIKQLAERSENVYADVEPISAFYRAEEYHQNFLNKQRSGAGKWVR